MQTIEFTLPDIYPLANTQRRGNFVDYRKIRKRIKNDIISVAYELIPKKPFLICEIEILRASPHIPDNDGLLGGQKPLIDCLVRPREDHPDGLSFIVDDSIILAHTTVQYRFLQSPEKPYTKVKITEIDETNIEFKKRIEQMNITDEFFRAYKHRILSEFTTIKTNKLTKTTTRKTQKLPDRMSAAEYQKYIASKSKTTQAKKRRFP